MGSGRKVHAGAWLLALAVLLASPSAAGQSLAARLAELHRTTPSHAARLEAISGWFVGAAYQRSPLGEGAGTDPDPIVRFDRFDCVTYVETVMALSWFADLDRATRALQRVRYRNGEIRFGARNHLMMAQWIPHNTAAGFVRDVTHAVAPAQAARALLVLDETSYRNDPVGLAPADRPLGRYALPLVPLARFAEVVARVPHGTIVTTIRSARAGRPYRATHLGLALRRDGRTVIRHADARKGRVVEEPMAAFLARARRQRWPVEGLNLLAVEHRAQDRRVSIGHRGSRSGAAPEH